MKRFWLATLAAVAMLVAVIGCSQEDKIVGLDALSYFSVDKVNGTEGYCTDLLAGQTIVAGQVCYEVDMDNVLHVTYTTTGGWELTEAHFWAGCSSTGYPMTSKGNPIPGQFPYNSGDITGATSFSFSVDLNDPAFAFCLGEVNCEAGNILFTMAHAAVRKANGDGSYQTETGWGGGSRVVQKGNWATQSTLTLFDDACGGGDPMCYEEAGTAFAFGGNVDDCFLNFDINANRWGWSNGPYPTPSDAGYYSTFTHTWDLWVGAGAANDVSNCDPNTSGKGTKVGTATVTINYLGTVTVDYALNAPYTLAETHVYVGCDRFPLKNGEPTVAPGQYGNQHTFVVTDGVTTDSYTLSASDIFPNGLCPGGWYIIIHAKVMEEVACAQ